MRSLTKAAVSPGGKKEKKQSCWLSCHIFPPVSLLPVACRPRHGPRGSNCCLFDSGRLACTSCLHAPPVFDCAFNLQIEKLWGIEGRTHVPVGFVSTNVGKAFTWKTFRMTVRLYGRLDTMTAILASLLYQNSHSEENGSVKDRCLDNMAQTMVKKPKEKGKRRASLFFRSRRALTNSGSGMDMIMRSLVRLKVRLTIK